MTPLREVATLLIAVYGATLSTVIFLSARRDQRARIKTSAEPGFTSGPHGVSENLLILTVANVGRVPVAIAAWSMRLPSGTALVFPGIADNARLPLDLNPGKGFTVHIPMKPLIAAMKENGCDSSSKVVPEFRDQTGKIHRGTRLRLNKSWWE